MVYKQYTMSGKRGVLFGWRCPKCGKLNLGAHTVNAAASYDDRGILVSMDRRKAKAQAALEESLDKRAMDVLLDVETRRFDKARLRAKCDGCGESPAWANLPLDPPKPLKTLKSLSLTAAIILVVVGLFSNKDTAQQKYLYAAIAAGVFALLTAVCQLIKRRRYADALPAIEALAPENLPHMAKTGPELIQRLSEDDMLTGEEAAQMDAPPRSTFSQGSNTLAEHYRTAAIERKKQRRTRGIAIAVVAALALAGGGLLYSNSVHTKQWQAAMEAADLFTVAPEAGDKIVVLQDRLGKKTYLKKHADSSRFARTPEEAGYIVCITDRDVEVGAYGSNMIYGASKKAYKVFTDVRLYDRHTGRYIGDTLTLEGGAPPSSIKSTQAVGRGSRPSNLEINRAVSKLLAQIDAD